MSNKFSNIKERVLQLAEFQEGNKQTFFKKIGMTYGNFTGEAKKTPLNSTAIGNILLNYPQANLEWLITGEGDMLKSDKKSDSKNLIPFYSDIGSVGGSTLEISNGKTSVEYIDAGDWFPNASAAIRHYGDSMIEYPSGCILALKEIQDLEHGFILGQNYVVEYGEDWNRVTKRIQKDGKRFMAYSSNEDCYKDGHLIHQPFELVKIHRAWRVLGYVVKNESSNVVINVQVKPKKQP